MKYADILSEMSGTDSREIQLKWIHPTVFMWRVYGV